MNNSFASRTDYFKLWCKPRSPDGPPPPRRTQRLAMDLSLSWGSHLSHCAAEARESPGSRLPLSGAGSLPSQGQRLAVQVALPSPPPPLDGGREGGALGVTDLGQAVYQV